MDSEAPNELLTAVEAFMLEHKLSATRFGALAMGDTKFVKTLRAGRKVRKTTVTHVEKWMATQSGESQCRS